MKLSVEELAEMLKYSEGHVIACQIKPTPAYLSRLSEIVQKHYGVGQD